LLLLVTLTVGQNEDDSCPEAGKLASKLVKVCKIVEKLTNMKSLTTRKGTKPATNTCKKTEKLTGNIVKICEGLLSLNKKGLIPDTEKEIDETPEKETESGEIQDEKESEILRLHNFYRNKVAGGYEQKQPGVKCGMKKLRLNNCLQRNAQRLADTRIYNYDMTNDCGLQMGQNIAHRYTHDPIVDWPWVMRKWYDEVNRTETTRDVVVKYDIERYTQVVWSSINELGCGYKQWKVRNYYETIYVCNYNPAGNLYDQKPYETVDCFSDCTCEHDQTYQFLCK